MAHNITTANPDAVLRVLQTLFVGEPTVRIEIDQSTGGVIAYARPAQHRTIQATIAEMEQRPERLRGDPAAQHRSGRGRAADRENVPARRGHASPRSTHRGWHDAAAAAGGAGYTGPDRADPHTAARHGRGRGRQDRRCGGNARTIPSAAHGRRNSRIGAGKGRADLADDAGQPDSSGQASLRGNAADCPPAR